MKTKKPIMPLLAVSLAGALLLISCQPQDYSAQLKPSVDAFLEAWNTGDVDGLDAALDPGFVRHDIPSAPGGGDQDLDSLKANIKQTRSQFPNFKVSLVDEIYSENKAAIHWLVTADGPGGDKIEVYGASVNRFVNGKLAEEWVYYDNLALSLSLGATVIPASPPIDSLRWPLRVSSARARARRVWTPQRPRRACRMSPWSGTRADSGVAKSLRRSWSPLRLQDDRPA